QDGNVIAVKEVAEKIDAEARPGDSVVDAFVSSDSPTPLTPLEAHLRDGIPYVTLGQPEGPPPYLPFGTTVPSPAKELRKAFRDTSGRVFLRVPSGVAVEQYRRGGGAGNDTFLIDRRLVLPRGATIESERSFPAVTGSDLYVIDSGS
ncbi:MAG: hypothetical protein J0H98_07945, partial [Solirubrobacterales bacterium]|nr:hypothetical protein [Solirubrobacterales bacterium]